MVHEHKVTNSHLSPNARDVLQSVDVGKIPRPRRGSNLMASPN